jgi:hypothetical protein
MVNLEDENHVITIGPHIEERIDASPPFYISLNIHDKILHNYLMDSGALHNVMPKVVIEELGLDITRPYHDLYSFDSKKVKCLGVMKDVAVTVSIRSHSWISCRSRAQRPSVFMSRFNKWGWSNGKRPRKASLTQEPGSGM